MAIIVIATLLPFGGMPAERIPPAWCLKCGALWLTDAIANVALFIPFGAAFHARYRSFARAVIAALLFSAAIELLQSEGLPPGRSAALADIFTNTVGGVAGALAFAVLRHERSRSARAAAWMAVVWAGVSVVMFTMSSRALQPYRAAKPDTQLVLSKSAFGHVPGHGWYEGVNDSASVNGTIVRQGWSGPIIREANAEALPVHAAVWVRGTDPLGGQIPLLFVHQPGDSAAWLQIAKHGDDAELTVMRTAWKWGLTFPSVIVPKVFAHRTPSDSSTVALRARVTSSTLSLSDHSAGDTLRLTPLLGWSLIQPVFTVQSSFAGFAQWSWVWLWLLPVTAWARRSGWRTTLPACLSVAICAWLAALPSLFALAPLGIDDWGCVLTALASGPIVARVLRPRQLNNDRDELPSELFGTSTALGD